MDAADLYPPLLGASVALSAAIALVVAADRRTAPPLKGAMLALVASGAAYSAFVGPAATSWPRALQGLLLLASASGVVFFWMVARLLFDPAFRPARAWRVAGLLLAAGVVAPVGLAQLDGGHRAGAMALLSLLAAALVLHVLALLVWGRRDDLDEHRRHWRLVLAAAAALYVVVVLVARQFGALQGRPAEAAAWLAGAQAALKLAWLWLLVEAPSPLLRLYATTQGVAAGTEGGVQAAGPSAPSAPSAAPAPPTVAEALAARQAQAVVQAMEEQRLYRLPGLGIGALAERLNLPEHRLRALINGQLDFKNYSAFLNHYRLREVARRLRDPGDAHLPILSIALDEGYASLAPFNRAFREAFGCSPSEYRRAPA